MKYFDELVKLSELLQREKKHEVEGFEAAIKNKTIHERKASGKCLFPLEAKKTSFGLSGLLEIELEADPQTEITHFGVGSVVSIFKTSDNIKSEGITSATVKYSKNNKICVQLNADEEPDDLFDSSLGLDLTIDARSYKVMEHTLNVLINSEDREKIKVLKKLWGDEKCGELELKEVEILPNLNKWQNESISMISQTEDFSVIHGPPGTGKTTTLVQAVKVKLKEEKQVLVCANSNAAVDHLVKCLVKEDVSVVRIGNIARVDDEVLSSQIDFKIQADKDYKLVKELKKRAGDSRKKAEKFKRSFNSEDRENRRMWYKEARDLMKEARETESYLIHKTIDSSQVIAATLIGSDSDILRESHFETAFIDEAGQALIPAVLTPFKRADKLVLAGDPFQLPPLVKNSDAEKAGLGVSLLESVMNKTENRTKKLRVQYRMDEKIMSFSNSKFYENELIADNSVSNHGLTADGFSPLEFIDTAGCDYEEEFSKSGRSLKNSNEAELLRKRLEELLISAEDCTFGIISPYRGQVNYLKDVLSEKENWINTIDAFQGQERDVILVSLVRSNEENIIGFLKDYRRMNVAMTRARKKLILIGDSSTIGADGFYSDFLEHVETNGSYRSAWEYM